MRVKTIQNIEMRKNSYKASKMSNKRPFPNFTPLVMPSSQILVKVKI